MEGDLNPKEGFRHTPYGIFKQCMLIIIYETLPRTNMSTPSHRSGNTSLTTKKMNLHMK